MTEDPLERIEREEREKKNRNSGLRTAMIALAVVAVALAAALGYIWNQKSTLVGELETEKADLTAQMLALQSDFENLNSDYENINHQLDTSREQVAALIDKLQKTEATNRAKIRQYEKELGTLRSIMKGYIVQIDSLNTLNKRLTADAAAARREADESRRANEQLTQQVENLSLHGDIESRDALVAHYEFGLHDERAGYDYALPLSAAELVRVAVEPTGIQTHLLHELKGAVATFVVGGI